MLRTNTSRDSSNSAKRLPSANNFPNPERGDAITYTGYYYDANTDRIEMIGPTTLTSVKKNNLTTILLATIIPSVAVIGVGAGLGIYFAKKKKAKIAA